MDLDRELQRLASQYTKEGFSVRLLPGETDLPPFAKDFVVEILGRREGGGVLVSVKRNLLAMQDDNYIPRYAEATNAQPGWRYDLIILEREPPMARLLRSAKQPSPDEIAQQLQYAERVLDAGFVNPALITAWASLEAAMRGTLHRTGDKIEWGADPESMLAELYSSGFLSVEDDPQLEAARKLRNEIVHGFSPAPVDPETVTLLIRTARQLLEQAQVAEQPA